ncbi:ATP-binding cassette domain-containing protein [Flexithrix dorotheae]|uniref:ABC transporter ATP-binding protein n=1 Tax=Flexithrix dorotheae TaxID=70993 RepID=UPI00036AFC56|nr:ABC transporter ATP-binding protein [Flexithrix dorotheae]
MINIQDLSYSYTKKKKLFDQLSLELPSGNIYGLLGKNGAGKSTLLKIIAGLLTPNSGSCEVFGFAPLDRNPSFLKDIYFISEEFHVPPVKIKTFVNVYAPFYPNFDHEAFNRNIAEFSLPTDQKLSNMSYGQKKKFLICFGLATNCKLLILDEPTNGLDIPSKSKFRKIVASSMSDERSFIISTHQVRDMENLIDPIIIVDNGKIIFNYSYEEVTRKLAFKTEIELSNPDYTLYSESALGGYAVVTENQANEETETDLETLFNAVISNKDKVSEIFNK